jgi:hypothetical protein
VPHYSISKAVTWKEDQHKRDEKGRFAKQGAAPHRDADGLVLYHGTRLRHIESILGEGFDVNGTYDDFGNAVYFKSPDFDKHDHNDFAAWRDKRLAQGKSVPKHYLERRGEDTTSVVNEFAGWSEKHSNGDTSYDGVVIEAIIDRNHVLDCADGRPAELQELIQDYRKTTDRLGRIQLAFKHILGEPLPDDFPIGAIEAEYSKRKADFDGKWGDLFTAHDTSPYEVYARRHKVGAIVDKLDRYAEEGWQIGVYNPSLIRITQHGRHMNFEDGAAKLIKALVKAWAERNQAYCLVHHEMTDAGLVLHIGAYRDTDQVEKSITDFRSLLDEWRGDEDA